MRRGKTPNRSQIIMKLAGLCGILAALFVFGGIGGAMAHAPWFDWTQHALSDLGVLSGLSTFFNSGMVLAGVCFFVFSLGLTTLLSKKLGGYLLCISSLALISIGLFPETIYAVHIVSSSLFFILLILSFFVVGFTLTTEPFQRHLAPLAILFATFSVISVLFFLPCEGIAIPEALSCFPEFLWCMVVGSKMTLL